MEFPGERVAFPHFSSIGFEQSHGIVTFIDIHKLLDGQTDSCVRYLSLFRSPSGLANRTNLLFSRKRNRELLSEMHCFQPTGELPELLMKTAVPEACLSA